jgi:hypothetical protein
LSAVRAAKSGVRFPIYPFGGDLLLQALETELGGVQVYKTALKCAVHPELYDDDGKLRAVVECRKGSALKIAFAPSVGAFMFKRALPAGVVFPFDFGFVPGTRADPRVRRKGFSMLLLRIGHEIEHLRNAEFHGRRPAVAPARRGRPS